MTKLSVSTQNSFDTSVVIDHLAEMGLVSPQRMIQILDNLPTAITLTDKKGMIIYTNLSFTQVTGYSSAEVFGKNPSLLSYQSTPPEVYTDLWHNISKGKIWEGHLVNRRKDEQRYLAQIKIVPLKNMNEEVVLYIGMQTDVSERHVALTEKSNQDNIIYAILNTMPSALALINNEQEVILDNLAYKTLATDLDTEPVKLVIAELQKHFNGKQEQTMALTAIPKNRAVSIALETEGVKRWFTCKLLNLEIDDATIDSYFSPQNTHLYIMTITEFTREKLRDERQRITELQKMTAEIEMMYDMQESMHAVLHQLQAPVNMIESAVGMIHTGTASSSGMDAMNLALTASNNVLTLLRSSFPERAPETRQSTNINQVIQDISQMSTAKLLHHSITLRLSLAGTLMAINAQPSRLRVAFKKLLDNAIDSIVFNRCEPREILITTKIMAEGVSIIFEDSGNGIPEAHRLKVFQPFFTTKPTSVQGTRGIGLSIVQQVLNEHSGTVEMKSSVLGGSQVCVFIPRL